MDIKITKRDEEGLVWAYGVSEEGKAFLSANYFPYGQGYPFYAEGIVYMVEEATDAGLVVIDAESLH